VLALVDISSSFLLCLSFPEINEFTAPALFTATAACTTAYLLYFYFEDAPTIKSVPVDKPLTARRQSQNELANSSTCFGQITVYTACLVGCMFLNAFLKGPMSCFETLGIEFAESHFNMGRGEAGSIGALMGFLGAMTLIAMRIKITQLYDDTQIIMVGYGMFGIGILMNTFLDGDDPDSNPKWMYAASMFFIYTVGYPVCHVALVGLFSKGQF